MSSRATDIALILSQQQKLLNLLPVYGRNQNNNIYSDIL